MKPSLGVNLITSVKIYHWSWEIQKETNKDFNGRVILIRIMCKSGEIRYKRNKIRTKENPSKKFE